MSKVLPIVIVVCVFVVLMQYVDSQCSTDSRRRVFRRIRGTSYCIYRRRLYRYGREWRDLRPRKCLRCSCSSSGIECCGFGWALRGVINIPAFCRHKRVGRCGIEQVRRNDENQPCFSS